MVGKSNIAYIYALCCPFNGEVRYIGKTNNPKRRYREHLTLLNERTHKTNWIKKLLQQNVNPTIKFLEIVRSDLINDREIFWINKFNGTNLLNGTLGGDGGQTHTLTTPVLRSDGTIFKSVVEAANSCNSYDSHLINAIKQRRYFKGYRWGYLGEGILNPIKLKEYTVIYCSNGKEYLDPVDVKNKLGIENKNLSRAIKNDYEINGLRFSYSNNFPDRKRTGKKIKCVSNGAIYQSTREAASELNLCYKQINSQLKGKQKTVKGFRFEYEK